MVQKALIVGINKYPGAALQGCVNDALGMEAMVKDHFGFTNIRLLLDEQATTANIKDGLTWLVQGAQPGDVLLFHYSGHGSQIRDTSNLENEPDGLDEIICPIDLDWNTKIITDDYLKWAFDQVPAGVNLTVVLDCCHSGTALDQLNTYQPYGIGEARTMAMMYEKGSRYLPPPTRWLRAALFARASQACRSAVTVTVYRSGKVAARAGSAIRLQIRPKDSSPGRERAYRAEPVFTMRAGLSRSEWSRIL